jgi:vanillate O-demethylase monooxygenase subunit
MFIENAWYVAAWDHEVGRQKMLRRTLLDIPVVLYRREDGAPVALEDRCCHRHAPLSKGKLRGDNVECPYHGLLYDPSGQCIRVPGQTAIPPNARVRGFPTVERHHWIWIWMGDPALADESLIVPYPWKSADDWGDKGTYFHVNGNYKLVIDNLLDLSHLAFVHRSTIGNAAVAEHAVLKTLKDDDSVTVARWTIGQNPPPTYQKMCDWPEETIVDRWQIIEFRMPRPTPT